MENEEMVWTTAKRQGKCASCGHDLEIGETILWSITNKSHAWCRSCGEGELALTNSAAPAIGPPEKVESTKQVSSPDIILSAAEYQQLWGIITLMVDHIRRVDADMFNMKDILYTAKDRLKQ